MVHHTDKSPLVEVLGSFTSNTVMRKSHEKYRVVRYSNGMHIDMRMRFSMNFGHEKFTRKISCNFISAGIRMPVYSGNIYFSKIPVAQNSVTQRIPRKMLNQYY